MQLELNQDEVQFIVNVMSELPTKTGCFPLMQKIVAQAQAQVPKEGEVIPAAQAAI